MSNVYSLASYDESSASFRLDSDSIIHKGLEVEDYLIISYCFSDAIYSSPIYTFKGKKFGNLVSVARNLLPQIIFSEEIKKELISKLANLIPESQLKYVISALDGDDEFFEHYHYDGRDVIEGITINTFFVAMGIIYYIHKFHFQNLVIKDGDDISPVSLQSIYTATDNEDIGRLEVLISHNRDLDIQTGDGATIVYIAAQKGYEDMVQTLISAGVNLDIMAEDRTTALYIASQEGHEGIVQKLINAGASLDIQARNGSTALYIASQEGHEGIVQKLINAGARIDTQLVTKNTMSDNDEKDCRDDSGIVTYDEQINISNKGINFHIGELYAYIAGLANLEITYLGEELLFVNPNNDTEYTCDFGVNSCQG